MAGPKVEIRSAKPEEMTQAIASLVGAFLTDPLARFACPHTHEYFQVMPEFFRIFGGEAFAQDTAFVPPDLCGAALWLPPDVRPDEEALGERMADGVEPAHLEDMAGTFEQMDEFHPEEEHWYLPLIGIEPFAQGRGLGGALMRHAVERFDREGAIAYLESSNPRNISLYERHGFEIMGEIQVGAAPVVTPMVRHPRQ